MDTSAVLSGIWSAAGASKMILKLAEAGVVILVIGPRVRAELQAAFTRKAPGLLAELALVLDCCRPEMANAGDGEVERNLNELVGHPGDAAVLAEAWSAGADYFATLDRSHILDNPRLRAAAPFPVGTPGDCLAWLREGLLAQFQEDE